MLPSINLTQRLLFDLVGYVRNSLSFCVGASQAAMRRSLVVVEDRFWCNYRPCINSCHCKALPFLLHHARSLRKLPSPPFLSVTRLSFPWKPPAYRKKKMRKDRMRIWASFGPAWSPWGPVTNRR